MMAASPLRAVDSESPRRRRAAPAAVRPRLYSELRHCADVAPWPRHYSELGRLGSRVVPLPVGAHAQITRDRSGPATRAQSGVRCAPAESHGRGRPGSGRQWTGSSSRKSRLMHPPRRMGTGKGGQQAGRWQVVGLDALTHWAGVHRDVLFHRRRQAGPPYLLVATEVPAQQRRSAAWSSCSTCASAAGTQTSAELSRKLQSGLGAMSIGASGGLKHFFNDSWKLKTIFAIQADPWDSYWEAVRF